MGAEPDGTLADWRDIATAHDWDTLLLGNGMSINIWQPFQYRELYDHAKAGALSPADRRLFGSTPNFERVMGELLTAIRVNKALGLDVSPLIERYQNIQLALVGAVRAVHLNRERVPQTTREAVRNVMKGFEWVFTTSYDLLAYWAMACRGFGLFMDHFRFGDRCEFDPERALATGSRIPVYFLHGALHLVTGHGGATWKLTQGTAGSLDSLLNQFGKPIKGDASARPLVITEGSAEDKLEAIEDNVYLSHALDRLYERDLPIVVFGSSLSAQDAHLVEALSQHPDRPVAISMLPGPRKALRIQQNDLYGRLDAELLFYDATTHPLGSPSLSVSPLESD